MKKLALRPNLDFPTPSFFEKRFLGFALNAEEENYVEQLVDAERSGETYQLDELEQQMYRKGEAYSKNISMIAASRSKVLQRKQTAETKEIIDPALDSITKAYVDARFSPGVTAAFKAIAAPSVSGFNANKVLKVGRLLSRIATGVSKKNVEKLNQKVLQREHEKLEAEAQRDSLLDLQQKMLAMKEDSLANLDNSLSTWKFPVFFLRDRWQKYRLKRSLHKDKKFLKKLEKKLEAKVAKKDLKLLRAQDRRQEITNLVTPKIKSAEETFSKTFSNRHEVLVNLRDKYQQQKITAERELRKLKQTGNLSRANTRHYEKIIANAVKSVKKVESQLAALEKQTKKAKTHKTFRSLAFKGLIEENTEQPEWKEIRDKQQEALNQTNSIKSILGATRLGAFDTANAIEKRLRESDDINFSWPEVFQNQKYQKIWDFLLHGQLNGQRVVTNPAEYYPHTRFIKGDPNTVTDEFHQLFSKPFFLRQMNHLAQGKNLETAAWQYLKKEPGVTTEFDAHGLSKFLDQVNNDQSAQKLINLGFDQAKSQELLRKHGDKIDQDDWALLAKYKNTQFFTLYLNGIPDAWNLDPAIKVDAIGKDPTDIFGLLQSIDKAIDNLSNDEAKSMALENLEKVEVIKEYLQLELAKTTTLKLSVSNLMIGLVNFDSTDIT